MNTKKSKSDSRQAVSLLRSSAAEYLTFIAASGQGGVEALYADENIWLSQKMMATLYDVNVRTANYHLKKIFSDNELNEDSVIQYFRITAADGKNYKTRHYNLAAIIAVGYKVNSELAKAHAESEFEKYRIVQDRQFESDFDRLLKQLEAKNDIDTKK